MFSYLLNFLAFRFRYTITIRREESGSTIALPLPLHKGKLSGRTPGGGGRADPRTPPDATLAQMYGDKMYLFPELVAAHEANDRAVLAAYGLAPDTPEPEIVAHLFKLYAEKVKGLDNPA